MIIHLNEFINLTITGVGYLYPTVIWGVGGSWFLKLISRIHIVTPIDNDSHSQLGLYKIII